MQLLKDIAVLARLSSKKIAERFGFLNFIYNFISAFKALFQISKELHGFNNRPPGNKN
jgi:hypothetical protein